MLRRPDTGGTGGRDNNALIGHSRATPYIFSLPAILLVAAILGFPVIYGTWQSFFRAPSLGAPVEFVGFENYADMFSGPEFWHALNRTAVFVFGSLILGTVLGLLFSFALFRVVGKLRFLRAVTVAPYIISNVAAAVMFRLLFNSQFGAVNQVIEFFGLDGLGWLSDPGLAMFVVIVTQVWTDLPLTILVLLGGLMTIDKSYLDAALVDGATGWTRARSLTIPLPDPPTGDQHRVAQLLHPDRPRSRAGDDRWWAATGHSDACDGDVHGRLPRSRVQPGAGHRHVHPDTECRAHSGLRGRGPTL